MGGESVGITQIMFESSELGPLIASDHITPSQHADTRRSSDLLPERMLYLAILKDAIECWLSGGLTIINPRKQCLARKAEQWIWGADGTVSFETCCGALGIAADWLRSHLRSIETQRPIKLAGIRRGRPEGERPDFFTGVAA